MIILLLLFFCQVRGEGMFPEMSNIAVNKVVRTNPRGATCGSPMKTAHCKSFNKYQSFSKCQQEQCHMTCPTRLFTPGYTDMSAFGRNSICIVKDTVNLHPGSSGNDFSMVFMNSKDCILRPDLPVYAEGFTVVFWMRQRKRNTGCIFSAQDPKTNGTYFSFCVSATNITFEYLQEGSLKKLSTDGGVEGSVWHFVALQVSRSIVSVFVNGTDEKFRSKFSSDTKFPLEYLGNMKYLVGRSVQNSKQYTGHLQKLRYYMNALTNREIEEIYSGSFPRLHVETDCRCPDTHTRPAISQTRFCQRNDRADTSVDKISRISPFAHPKEFVNDGDPTSFWVSSFLDEVELEVDLGDTYQVFYVTINFYTPFPSLLQISKRIGRTNKYTTWQYYASDCKKLTGLKPDGLLKNATQATCMQYKKANGSSTAVPYSNGNITFNLFSTSRESLLTRDDPELVQFSLASAVKFRLRGHHYVAESDTTNLHRYFGIYEISIVGRCDCNGHARECKINRNGKYKCLCADAHHTAGRKCQKCSKLFNSKPFQRGTRMLPYPCKPCTCNSHAESCFYNSTKDSMAQSLTDGSGGVCECLHLTTGQYCERCDDGAFREQGVKLSDKDACQNCNCDPAGILPDQTSCDPFGGQCNCKQNADGRACDTCKSGFYNLIRYNPLGCENCGCDIRGVKNEEMACNVTTGQCLCKKNVDGRSCDKCQYGYHNLTRANPLGCDACGCHPIGSVDLWCDRRGGVCQCKQNVVGEFCNDCARDYYNITDECLPCMCDPLGTVPDTKCDTTSGQCVCKKYAFGRQCGECMTGYWNLGGDQQYGCLECMCDVRGTMGGVNQCDLDTGLCICKENVQGDRCQECKPGTWSLTSDLDSGCLNCTCAASGTQLLPNGAVICDANSGQCACLPDRLGKDCDYCEKGFWAVPSPQRGCAACDCDPIGSIPNSLCNPRTGQCMCRRADVGNRRCDGCADGYYGFDKAKGTCEECGCDPRGSLSSVCNPITGQCACKEFVMGQRCDHCTRGASSLSADNPFGCSTVPSQQPPPFALSRTPNWLQINWDPPDYPNAGLENITYVLYRNGTELSRFNGSEFLEFNDTTLLPYTLYQYEVEVANDHGSSKSRSIIFRTDEDAPGQNVSLVPTEISPTRISWKWSEPSPPNGEILSYTLKAFSNLIPADGNRTTLTLYQTDEREGIAEGLEAFTNYTFFLGACTKAGCEDTMGRWLVTPETKPYNQTGPKVKPLTADSIYVFWEPPDQPNGVIIGYEVWLRGMIVPATPSPYAWDSTEPPRRFPMEQLVCETAGWYHPWPKTAQWSRSLSAADPPNLFCTVTGLEPYTEYEFKVVAKNSIGQNDSPWVWGRTLEAPPISFTVPSATSVSPTQIEVRWTVPRIDEIRGDIVMYKIFSFEKPKNPYAPPLVPKLIGAPNPASNFYRVSGLRVYTNYTFMMSVCNNVGCFNTSIFYGRTTSAEPEGLNTPDVAGLNATSLVVTWDEPEKPNGPPPYYQLERVLAAFAYPPPRVEQGVRFSGLVYYEFPHVLPPQEPFTGFEVSFRTTQADGVILFCAMDTTQDEMILVQLRHGRPYFVFDMQGCPNIVSTYTDEGKIYNDGEWHRMRIIREHAFAEMIMDEEYHGRLDDICHGGSLMGETDITYFGGLPATFKFTRKMKDQRGIPVKSNFLGCMRDFQVLKQLDPDEIWEPLNFNHARPGSLIYPNWEGCPTDAEPAMHCLGRGYLEMGSSVSRPIEGVNVFRMRFDVRTEFDSGLLFMTFQLPNNFLLGQIEDNKIVLYMGLEGKVSLVRLDLKDKKVCDGAWHFLEFQRDGRELMIVFDGKLNVKGGSRLLEKQFTQDSSLFVGGIRNDIEFFLLGRNPDIKKLIKPGFGGCIRSLYVNDRLVLIQDALIYAQNVNFDGCLRKENETLACRSSNIDKVFIGNSTNFTDTDLLPFTEYVYRVGAGNQHGIGYSGWEFGRTRPGPPRDVNPLYDVDASKSRSVFARWRFPYFNTGPIDYFAIRAENPDNLNGTVETRFADADLLEGTIVGLEPFTTYDLYFVAATEGGRTVSTKPVRVTTKDDVPEQQLSPDYIGFPDSLTIRWDNPLKENGLMTGYILYIDDRPIMKNMSQSHQEFDLRTFTPYRISVDGCNAVGCVRSPEIIAWTAQLPPSWIDEPVVYPVSDSEVKVQWTPPLQPNGVLTRYVVFVTQNDSFYGIGETSAVVKYEIEQMPKNETVLLSDAFLLDNNRVPLLNVSINSSIVEEYKAELNPQMRRKRQVDDVPMIASANTNATNGTMTDLFDLQPEPYTGPIPNVTASYNSSDLAYQSHVVSDLKPGTKYYIWVGACTNGGCRLSQPVSTLTYEAAPQGLAAPVVTSPNANTLVIRWKPPEIFNGFLTDYFLYHYDVPTRLPPNQLNFTIPDLPPYSKHKFRIEACTVQGCSPSETVTAYTSEMPPNGDLYARMRIEDPNTLSVMWNRLLKPNGNLTYTVYAKGLYFRDPDVWDFRTTTERRAVYDGKDIETWIKLGTKFIPFSNYTLVVNASNSRGFVLSNEELIEMPPGLPDGVRPPRLNSPNPYTIDAVWETPGRINAPGEIAYQLHFTDRVPGKPIKNMFPFPTKSTALRIPDLQPFTPYEVRLAAINNFYTNLSEWQEIVTQEAPPTGFDTPRLVDVGSRHILLYWFPPLNANGLLNAYQVFINNNLTAVIQPNVTRYNATDLRPWTFYEFYVFACTGGGCTPSPTTEAKRTMADFSERTFPPLLQTPSPTAVLVQVIPPDLPNGVVTAYRIQRRLSMPNESNYLAEPGVGCLNDQNVYAACVELQIAGE